jgi:hypothetical protein
MSTDRKYSPTVVRIPTPPTVALRGQIEAPSGLPQPDYQRSSQLVEQADHDPRTISHRDRFSAKDEERYLHALRDLSGLSQELSRGEFDKRQLDAIDSLTGVWRNNPLESREREALKADVRGLRELRAAWRSEP